MYQNSTAEKYEKCVRNEHTMQSMIQKVCWKYSFGGFGENCDRDHNYDDNEDNANDYSDDDERELMLSAANFCCLTALPHKTTHKGEKIQFQQKSKTLF